MELPEKKVLLLGKVNHSQRLRDGPLKVWILAHQDGSVVTAHSSCMAGSGEACSHIGATLFFIEARVRIREPTSCTSKENVWLPPSVKNIEHKRIKYINFASSKTKKRKLDSALTDHSQGCSQSTQQSVVPPPTLEELDELYSAFAQSGATPAVFSVLPGYNATFSTVERREPVQLRGLYIEEALSCTLEELIMKAESYMSHLTITNSMVTHVELSTRAQSRCSKWFLYRAGRITASSMKAVCGTRVAAPSISLLRRICYPEECPFQSASTKWGQEYETDAARAYMRLKRKDHESFSCRVCGLYLSREHPFMAATPDGIVTCMCCGEGVIEFKCPFSVGPCDPGSCLKQVDGQLRLKRNHAYFYQTRTQMLVCDVEYCDFVVWLPKGKNPHGGGTEWVHIERIQRDRDFGTAISAVARKFFVSVVLPELFTRFFTRQVASDNVQASENTYCYCGGPEEGKMIACDGKDCKYGWFHFQCIGLKRAPKNKHWQCPDCATTAR